MRIGLKCLEDSGSSITKTALSDDYRAPEPPPKIGPEVPLPKLGTDGWLNVVPLPPPTMPPCENEGCEKPC